MKIHQPTLFDGATMRDLGMAVAEDHANKVIEDWSEKAYTALCAFARIREFFLVEDAREHAFENGLPEPPSTRAWGGIIVRAAKDGVVSRWGYCQVKNPKAHRTPATLWRSHVYK